MSAPLEPLDLRLKLLANKYVPLPASAKAVRLTGWPSVRVTKKLVGAWSSDHASWANTGIRCDGLVAIDVDVTVPHVGERVMHSAHRILGLPGAIRVGSAPKFLLLYKRHGEGDGKKRATGRWADAATCARALAGEGVLGQAVEVLSGAGCQFIAYGVHPKTGAYYQWSEAHPLNLTRDALPGVGDDQVREFLDECREHFEAVGWSRLPSKRPADLVDNGDFVVLRDLGGDETIAVVAPDKYSGSLTVDALEALLLREAVNGLDHVRVTSPHSSRPGSDSGMASLNDDGTLRLVDFVEDTVRVRPQEDRDVKKVGEALAHVMKDERQAWLDKLMADYVYVSTEDACYHADHTDSGAGITVEAMKRMTRRLALDGDLLVDLWLKDRHAMRADARSFAPDRNVRVFEDDGRTYLNTYRDAGWSALGVARDDDARRLALWHDFMGHLVPDGGEREIVLDWIANKVQRPWDRMWGLMMVAPYTFGTGRGTLTSFLSRLFGHRYVLEVKFRQFIGAGSQGQFYDWLYESLVVHVPEVFGRSGAWKDKRESFERLKEIIDPGGDVARHLPRKYSRAANARVYASTFLATNYPDALPISTADRRLFVVSNGKALDERMRVAVRGTGEAGSVGWLGDDANVAALYRWAQARRVTADLHGQPLETDAKREMVASSRSSLDEAFDLFCDFVRDSGSVVFIGAQFERFCRSVVQRTTDVDPPEDLSHVLTRGGAAYFSGRGCAGGHSTASRCMFQGKRVRFRGLPGVDLTASELDPPGALERVEKALAAAVGGSTLKLAK